MTAIIVTFKLGYTKRDLEELDNNGIDDMFKEIAEENEMELVSWGTI